jgi:hypothetical protein
MRSSLRGSADQAEKGSLLKYAALAVFFATAILTHRPFPKAAKIAPRIADLHAKE